MRIISHRGNLRGREEDQENTPGRIDHCISIGLDVEVDVWKIDDEWFLGHDYPKTKISIDFLEERKYNLWVHCKNISALGGLFLENFNGNYFWHEEDKYTMTSKGFLWTYPAKDYAETFPNQIILDFSEMPIDTINSYKEKNIYGLCVDYAEQL